MPNFPITNIFYPLIRTRTCAYQGVKNISFSEKFAYVINEWSLFDNKNQTDQINLNGTEIISSNDEKLFIQQLPHFGSKISTDQFIRKNTTDLLPPNMDALFAFLK